MKKSLSLIIVITGAVLLFSNCAKDTVECLTITCPATFQDARDGTTYKAVTICNQCWMQENLNYAVRDGSWCFENVNLNCNTYGRLYDWNAVMNGANASGNNPSGVQGVCPAGWHVPSQAEWNQLIDYMNDKEYATGDALMKAGAWDNNTSASNETGFTALPAGYYDVRNSTWKGLSLSTCYWTTTGSGQDHIQVWWLNYNQHEASDDIEEKEMRFSLRCIRDQ